MVKSSVSLMYSGLLEDNLFEAAKEDDVSKLKEALDSGQSLNTANSRLLNMTPIHLACVFSSNAFLKVALNEGEVDPWLRDANGRVAFDHAWARNNTTAMRLLYVAMHPNAPPLEPSL